MFTWPFLCFASRLCSWRLAWHLLLLGDRPPDWHGLFVVAIGGARMVECVCHNGTELVQLNESVMRVTSRKTRTKG